MRRSKVTELFWRRKPIVDPQIQGLGEMTKQGFDFLDVEREALVEMIPMLEGALELRRRGKVEQAERILRHILETEPRLAEPRLEIAHIAIGRTDLDEAEGQLRVAIDVLRSHGQWTLDVDPDALMSYALNFLGEVLISVFEDPDNDEFDEGLFSIWNEAAGFFAEAAELDPQNEDAALNASRFKPVAGSSGSR